MDAACQCGQLQAHIAQEARPFTVLCHCADCQRRTGSPFGVIGYFPKQAVKTEGEAREFTRTNDLGNSVTGGFCPSCGSTIYILLSKSSDLVGVPVGAFSNPDFPEPVRAVWEQGRHGWITLPETMERHERGADRK